jgi:hypothetical protein
VADDGLARDAETRLDVAELPVAVGGLVEVHEVEVDLGPGQLDVRLRVQVQQRLLQRVEARDPHLRGAERVHPRDDADDRVVAFASSASRRMASESVRTGFHSTVTGSPRGRDDLLDCSATWRASPRRRAWLPVTNQTV